MPLHLPHRIVFQIAEPPARRPAPVWFLFWALLLGAYPALAQRPKSEIGTGFGVGPSFPMGKFRGNADNGFDFATTFDYAFEGARPLWLRVTLDVAQYNFRDQVNFNGAQSDLDINGSINSLFADIGLRPQLGRFAPFVYVGGGGAYLSSSRFKSQQNDQSVTAGRRSNFTYVLHTGAGAEYDLKKSKLTPYIEASFLALPDARLNGQRFLFFTPLIGTKIPL